MEKKIKRDMELKRHGRNILVGLVVFCSTTIIGYLLSTFLSNPTFPIAVVYTVGVIAIARYTDGSIYNVLFSIAMVLSVDNFFIFPEYSVNLSLSGYEVTFIVMLSVAFTASILVIITKKYDKDRDMRSRASMEIQKERMRSNLLRAISHDLRTPLTGIIGNSSSYLAMEEELSAEDKRAMVESIQADAKWLLSMAENLLAVTRIDGDTAKVKKSLESVDDVIASSVSRFKGNFPDAKVRVRMPDDVLLVMMDPMLIQQVIINLLQNGYVHGGSKAPLELIVEADTKNLTFCIRDFGVGLDEHRIHAIFDGSIAHKKRGTNDSKKGMGIGLSVCKTIITAHGGTIEARNHENGAEFVFSLPRSKEELS